MSEQTEQSGPQSEVGVYETQARLSLQEGNWRTVTLDQFGPDGTEVIARLLFYVCPVCAATVAPGNEENDLRLEHADYHVRQAHEFDVLHGLIQLLAQESDVTPE